jgi:O-antigen/teichoic acid export membrane protein
MFYTAISQTFEPDIYKSIAENNKKRMTKITLGIILINAIPILFFIVFATPLTDFLTGGRYTAAANFAQILSLKNITTSFYYSVITIIVGFGFTKAELAIRVFGSIICILMYKILINNFGFWGAAWGQTISFLLMAIFGLIFILIKIRNRQVDIR